MTNIYLTGFSGSEIATFEIAKTLQELGHNICIATFKHAPPLKKLFQSANLAVYDLSKEELPSKEFDVAWVHHFPVFSHLIDQNIKVSNTILFSLSFYTPLECFPPYHSMASQLLANSRETIDFFTRSGLIKENLIEVFPNSVLDEYFESSKRGHNSELKKLAIISNHIPEEVRNAAEKVKDFAEVTFYGNEKGGEVSYITAEILNNYDAVLTIGRTVQYALALKIPVYCYDRFGGPGWISSNNIDQSEYYNFSGRCCRIIKTPGTIAHELKEGYLDIIKDVETLHEISAKRYRLKSNISKVLNNIQTKKKVLHKEILAPEDRLSVLNNRVHVEKILETSTATKKAKKYRRLFHLTITIMIIEMIGLFICIK